MGSQNGTRSSLRFRPHHGAHGFTDIPKRDGDNIGAAMGKALHEGFGMMWQASLDGYDANPEQIAIAAFNKLDNGAIKFDEKVGTKDSDYAKEQIKRMVEAYLPHAKTIKPKKMEFRLHARLDQAKPYIISGTPDILEQNDNIRDMKFGKNLSRYETQLGTYRLLGRSVGLNVQGLFIDWVPRSTTKKPQKPLEVVPYDVHVAENAAHYEIEYAVGQLDKFIETGNEWAFPAKPDNNLCSKKWCPAYNTSFCSLGRPSADEDEA